MKSFTIYSVITLSYLAFSTQSFADDKGFYTGFGISNYEFEEGGESSSNTGYGFIAGYTFNRIVDVEASIFDMGEYEELGMKANGFSISFIGKYSLNDNWQLFGELGGITLDVEIDEENTIMSEDGENSISDGDDTSLLLGYGVKYNFNKWSVILKSAEADTDADLSAITLSTTYKF